MVHSVEHPANVQPFKQSTIRPFNNINSLQLFQALQFGTAILIGVLLAKSGWPTSDISVYETLLFVASLCCFFWIVGGQNTLLQLYPRLEESAKPLALFNVYALFSMAGAISGGLLLLVKRVIPETLASAGILPYTELLAVFLLFNSPTFLIQIYYLLLKKYNAIVLFGSVAFALQIGVVVVPILAGASLKLVMVGLVIWALFKFAWGVVLLAIHARWRWDGAFVKRFLPLALPLVLFALVGKGSEYISGLMVTWLLDDGESFAIFRYGAREFPLAVLMVGALATSLLPEVSENLEKGLERIKTTTRQLSHLLYPMSMAVMLAAPLLFPIIFNPDFKASAKVFNIFTLLLASRILLPQVVAMGQGRNYVLTLSALLELTALLLLSWWLGRRFGLDGIAYAAVLAFMVDRLVLIGYNWKVLGIAPGRYVDWKNYLLYNAALIIVFLVSLQY